MPKIIYQRWIESERGWGQRPDGFSLHVSEEARIKYIRAYEDSLPDAVPDIYDRADGSPKEVEVSDEVFRLFFEPEDSFRNYQSIRPEDLQDHFEEIIRKELEEAVETAEKEKGR